MKTVVNQLRRYLLSILLVCACIYVDAQSRAPIVGRVSDVKGEWMIGVSILEKGTSNGVITDINGQYSISTSSAQPTLVISYIGYKTQEVRIGKKNVVDIVLEEDVSALDEVVVVGYGAQRKVSVVGSQSSIKMSDIKAATGDISSAIAGRIPGVVTIQRSGEPGKSGSEIWIRGISTFTSSSPLVLVDGVERTFNQLDPEDIESFTILKDASATAIYGSKGANGVVLITTKRGKAGKIKIDAKVETTYNTRTVTPKFEDGFTYASLMNESRITRNNEAVYKPE